VSTTVTKEHVRKGHAMPAPGQDRPGRFPIENRADLENAIRAVGRAKGGEKARRLVRRFVMKRARALGLSSMIPDNWNPDGSLKS
jgi:hypothetical protein